DRLPHLQRDEVPVAVRALAQQRREPAHRYRSLLERTLPPGDEGVLRLVERTIHLVLREWVEPREDLAVRRIDARDRTDARCHRQIEDSPLGVLERIARFHHRDLDG